WSGARGGPRGRAARAGSKGSAARAGSREPITTGTPARPSLSRSPKPSAPEAPRIATGSVAEGATRSLAEDGTAAEYRLHPVEPIGLEGRTALVTGGASGIGAATARRLAAEGARVAIGDLNGPGAREVAEELDGFACELDVSDTGSVHAAVEAAAAALGEIDVLVNNAGTDRFSFFVNSDEE